MKNVLFLCFLMMSLTQVFGQNIKFQYDSQENDFGFVSRRSYMTHEFKITNTGDAPLEIKKVSASCECLMATLSSSTIKPGESGVITAIFFAEEMGTFTHTLDISTNAKNMPTAILRLKGLVR
ncbi:MAG: DUF1573 domain-containing protein [Bacteroidia bacterium]